MKSMSSASRESDDRLDKWKDTWDQNVIPFHISGVHKMLQKHVKLLVPEGNIQKVFFPLCGKAVDMKWLADQGHLITGLDGVKKALEDFFNEQKLEWTEKEATSLGTECQLLESSDGKIKLYRGDVMLFNQSVNGLFDAVWDRGSLVALDRPDVPNYVKMLKSVLKPGGRIIVEVWEYDKVALEAYPDKPHAMFEDEMKTLFEPDCSVQYLDRNEQELYSQKAGAVVYLITKK